MNLTKANSKRILLNVKCRTNEKRDITAGEQYIYIDLSSVDRDSLSITDPQIIDKTNAPSRAKQIVKNGDVIFATTRPTLRRLCLIPLSFDSQICSTGFCVLRPKKDIDPRWIYYTLQGDKFYQYIEPLQTGASYPAVTDGIVKEYSILIPPLSEQKRIVSRLDSAFAHIDALKANAEKQLSDAKALFQKALEKAMEPKEGWEEKTIEYFAKIIHGKNQKEVLDDNGLYPIYGSGGNIMGYANSYLCDEGTTILGRKGTIDNPMYIEEKFWNVDTAFGIIAKDNCNKKFLFYSIKKIDWAKHNTGTTLPSLTQNVVYNIEMCAPSLSEQQKIVSRLDSLSENVKKLQEVLDKTIKECDALKQAILRQVFE